MLQRTITLIEFAANGQNGGGVGDVGLMHPGALQDHGATLSLL